MGRSRRAEVDLALTEEKSGLGWVGKRPKGDVDFCLELEGTSVKRVKLFTATASGPSRG
jgi:hypothetical protein